MCPSLMSFVKIPALQKNIFEDLPNEAKETIFRLEAMGRKLEDRILGFLENKGQNSTNRSKTPVKQRLSKETCYP